LIQRKTIEQEIREKIIRVQVIRKAEYQVKEQKTPGRETEKPAPGVNSRAKGKGKRAGDKDGRKRTA